MKRSIVLLVSLMMLYPAVALAQGGQPATEAGGERMVFGVPIPPSPVAPGTVVNMSNWQNYRQYMSDGLQAFFAGKYFWKFPSNFQMVVGPTRHYAPASKEYIEATEKYARQVKIVDLPGGGRTMTGYVAGLPFPNPQEPLRGWKLLVDMWYSYVPYILCGYDTFYEIDRFGNVYPEKVIQIYRRLGHVADYGQPVQNSKAPDVYYSEYLQVIAPEQSKYLTNLTLYYLNPSKPIDTFLFIPALRRSLRLSSAARCSPLIGTDFAQDDANKSNFNGNWQIFDGKVLRDAFTFELTDVSSYSNLGNLNNYYQPIFFPKPIIGHWEVRPVWVLDVRRIPSRTQGYCYGKKIFWVDKESYLANWIDAYDSNMKLWKIFYETGLARDVPHVGMTVNDDQWFNPAWDVQNSHLTLGMSTDPQGSQYNFMEQCRNYHGQNLDDVAKYSTSAGLSQILR